MGWLKTMQDSTATGLSRRRGLFIVLEGIDGAGKTTQARLLQNRIEQQGYPVISLREPTAGPWGMKIREIAAKGRQGVRPEDELEYFIRDREQDVRENINPALNRNDIVILDRYYYSTIAYQSALGLDPEEIRDRNAVFPVPDLVIILDLNLEHSQRRIVEQRGEKANLGYEQAAFLKKVKKAYDELNDVNIVRIDGSGSAGEIHTRIWDRVKPLLDPGGFKSSLGH